MSRLMGLEMRPTRPIKHYAKMYIYMLLGTGVIGIGLSLWLNLDKTIVLPFFPDVLDAISVVFVGFILLYEVFKQMRGKQPHLSES